MELIYKSNLFFYKLDTNQFHIIKNIILYRRKIFMHIKQVNCEPHVIYKYIYIFIKFSLLYIKREKWAF